MLGPPMSPMIDEEETGEVVKRTVVGGKKEFMDTIKAKNPNYEFV